MFWTYSHAHAPGQDATAPTVTTNDSLQPETAPSLGTGGVTPAGSEGAIWPLLFVVSYYSNVGPSQNFSYTLLIRFLKLGEGIPRLVVLVGSARQPDPRPPNPPWQPAEHGSGVAAINASTRCGAAGVADVRHTRGSTH